jgi:hypothetical protein
MNGQARLLRFDESLSVFAQAVVDVLGPEAFANGRALRDAFGRLSYVSSSELDRSIAAQLCDRLSNVLQHYFATDIGLIQPDEFGFQEIWSAPVQWELLHLRDGHSVYVNVVDRRIVGQDWLAPPRDELEPKPPRLVFWSAKGGVGRSTALVVLAVHLAQSGRDVLVVDADLEAPGLGSLLLGLDARPKYGLVDYLADNGLAPWSDEELTDFVAASLLTDRTAGQGLVDVAPAVGTATLNSPENMLAKLSRALLEDPNSTRAPTPVRDQLRDFVDRLVLRRHYDAVLVDARAGLAELAAGAFFALGATVMVFGVKQEQTFEDLRFLFSHLARMPHSSDPDRDWRGRFKFVHAKADPQDESSGSDTFKDKLYEVLSDEFYEEEKAGNESGILNFSFDDPQALHAPLTINFDFPFMRFDPVLHPTQLKRETYRAAFAEFLGGACVLLELSDVKPEAT